MIPRSLPQPANFSQLSFGKKERKFCHFSELPISKNIYLELKNSKKRKHRRQAKILERVHYLNQKGEKHLCYMKNKAIKEYLNKEGYECCSRTIDNDLKDLIKMNMLFSNSWNVYKYEKNRKDSDDVKWNGSVRHLVTPWDIYHYEKNYILATNKKGKPKPKELKKKFYEFKNRVMEQNFPELHNKKITQKIEEKIASVLIEPTKGINNYPPIIPPKGGKIVKISRKMGKVHHTERIRRVRRRNPPKIYPKIDDQRLIHALTREKSGKDALTATNPIGEMEHALATMCLQPQFSGREETLRTNFRIAWGLHRDRGTQWRKSPLHLAAHATLHGYAIKTGITETTEETKNTADTDYSILQPLLKWGIRTDPAPPEPLSKSAKYTVRCLAHDLQRDHGDILEDLGYRAEAYGLRCVTTCSDHTVPYDSPYVFAGLMEKCRDRGLVEIAEWFKTALHIPRSPR